MSAPIFPNWDTSDPKKSLVEIYQWTVDNATYQITWYENARRSKRKGSQFIRVSAILLAGLGALCPLVFATGVGSSYSIEFAGQDNTILLGQFGYIFLALAALIFSYDQYFGLSSGWMRYIITQESMEKALREFQYDWDILFSQQDTNQPGSTILLQRAKDFTGQINVLIRQETDAWVLEFQSSMSQLEKVLKTETEARKSGSIKVTITNAKEFDKVTLSLNNQQEKELISTSEAVFNSIPPGRYELLAVGHKKDKADQRDSKVIEVQANTMAVIEILIP